MFDQIAKRTADWTGRPAAFCLALAVIVVWALTGPLFGYSDTWQLIINTGTTIVTFLMVFLIQATQNRDTIALHVKLDGLIAGCSTTSNTLLDLEDRPRAEVDAAKRQIVEGEPWS